MIKKAEAMSKLTVEEDAAFAMWEQRIDGALRTHDGRTIVPCDASSRVRLRLIQAYRRAGWTVASGSNQRDGSWLEFT